jgi:16S rRNA processing protein RimM
VEGSRHPLPEGAVLEVAGDTHRIARRAGTDDRPLIRLADVDDPRPLRGELLLIEDELAEGEWLAADLLDCSVPGLGAVAQIIDGPSCSVLELEDGTLVPLVGDAIERIDLDAREIRVNREFLG